MIFNEIQLNVTDAGEEIVFKKTLLLRKKRKISKTRSPYNIRDAKHKPSCMRAQAGLTFFRGKLEFTLRNGTLAGEGL